MNELAHCTCRWNRDTFYFIVVYVKDFVFHSVLQTWNMTKSTKVCTCLNFLMKYNLEISLPNKCIYYCHFDAWNQNYWWLVHTGVCSDQDKKYYRFRLCYKPIYGWSDQKMNYVWSNISNEESFSYCAIISRLHIAYQHVLKYIFKLCHAVVNLVYV